MTTPSSDSPTVKTLAAYLKGQAGDVGSADIAPALGCTVIMARALINEGLGNGSVFMTGNRRSARYASTQGKADKALAARVEARGGKAEPEATGKPKRARKGAVAEQPSA